MSRARKAAGRRAPAGGRAPVEEQLTLGQVLARYQDGPDTGVFTDGSANPNPGPGGWGAVYVVDGEVVAQDHGSESFTTNNRMELTALLRGIELVPPGTPATVYSDSNLAVRTVTEWAAGWEKLGWKRKRGPVENLDLVRPLYEAMRKRPELELTWIKAHAGNRWNEYADSLATAWARDEL
jgi:ribonuclease HI